MNLLILDFDRTLFNLDRFLNDEARNELGDDYLFDDAASLLKSLSPGTEVIVVSQATMPKVDERTGVEWQHHKHTFAPALAKLPFYVTEDNKGFELARGIKREGDTIEVTIRGTSGMYERVLLVDDNAVSFQPLLLVGSPVEMYHLARVGEKYADVETPDGVTRISGLNEVTL